MAMGDAVPKLLNPDGYTALFNPTEFPPGSPVFPALKYYPGNYAPGGDLSSTLNPFVAYNKDAPRRVFLIETSSTRTIQVHLPGGINDFGYAIDACWQNTTVGIVDPVKEMPPDANCLDAYAVSVWAGPGLGLDLGAWTWVYATVYDHQGFDTISTVTAEIPGVISGTVNLDYYQTLPDGGFLFKGKVFNELNASTGDYPFLVKVMDKEADQNLGEIDAWQVGSLPVRRGWVLPWQGMKNGYLDGTEVDKENNIYTIAYGTTDTDGDPTPGFFPLPGEYDDVHSMYLNKFDWGGGLKWTCSWQNVDWSPNYSSVMALDHEGNPLVAGSFGGTVDLDPGPESMSTPRHQILAMHFCLSWTQTGSFSGL